LCAAGLINALHLSGKKIEDCRIVLNGAGAAGIACIELLKAMGARHENCIVCDTKGVIWQGRTEGMNQWKSAHAVKTELRTLEEAMAGRRRLPGGVGQGRGDPDMVKSMADNPVIFAMANPDPEITPEEAHEVRPDAIVATGGPIIPTRSTTCWVSLSVSRRARHSRPRHQRRDEDRLRRGTGRAWRARTCPTRSPWPMAAS
jgi:malate dehydrogenase (oxaloacetate-decarboxylating)(NADP+)